MQLKLPHWIGITLAVASIVIVQVTAAVTNGSLELPAQIVTILIITGKVVGLLSVSISPEANAKAALAAGDVVPLNVVQQAARNEVTK
jgi:hypothetical protein